MVPADPQQLPDDIDALKAMIAAAHAEIAELKIINATADERIARLTSIVAMLQRAQYGTRSERLRHDPLDDEQMAFVFDEIETGIEEAKAGLEARDRSGAAPRPPRPRKGFAPHLERIEQIIEPEVPADCVGLEAVSIGEDVSERLDVTPATFRVRAERSRPIVTELFAMLDRELPRLSGKSKLAEIIRYTLSRRTSFERFLADGHIEIDSNIVERAINTQTITRKNALFAGSDGGGRAWATIATLLTTAKMNGVDPHAWLTLTLERIAGGWPNTQIAELMPWNFSQ